VALRPSFSRSGFRSASAIWLCLCGTAFAAAATPTPPEEASVFAAASLADALAGVGSAWTKASGHRAVFNFGASSDLSRQIRAGAPADVFFSADSAQMDALEREGLVRRSDRHDLLSNTLVVIVPAASSATVAGPRDLAAFKTIAIADPQAVPAGVYARTWLEGLGLWSELLPRVVPTLHARAALNAVESENAEAGIVYRTDAAASKRARVALEVASAAGPRIRYAVAPLVRSPRHATASAFVAYLRSPDARAVFIRHGFRWLGGE
jgi:molybdate transport system substrate-binding protein